jgi:hypothetical protein
MENNMKYLVVMPEIAYVTKNDGNKVTDSWSAPKGKFFQPQETKAFEESVEVEEIFREVKVVDKVTPKV